MSSFLGAIIDICCGSMKADVTTTAYAQYVDIVWKANRRYELSGWALSETLILRNDIETFTSYCVDLFGPY